MTKKFVNPPGMKPLGMYTQVTVAQGGSIAFISGQVAVDSQGKVVGAGDIQAQAVQVFENLKLALGWNRRHVRGRNQIHDLYRRLYAGETQGGDGRARTLHLAQESAGRDDDRHRPACATGIACGDRSRCRNRLRRKSVDANTLAQRGVPF